MPKRPTATSDARSQQERQAHHTVWGRKKTTDDTAKVASEPMTLSQIPVLRPRLPDTPTISRYLERIDQARIYSNFGPLYQDFSERLADYFNVQKDQVALFANGTLALQAAIETVGEVGDAWVVPSWTFVATAQAVTSARRRVHFADVDPNTWALKPEDRLFARGQVVVAPFGDRPKISSWSPVHNFKVFDAASCFDACRGVGPELDDRSIMMISLHATKPLAAGEGALLVGPKNWVARAAQWGNFGFRGSRVATGPGLNAKLSEYHCAVGLASLDYWATTRESLSELTQIATNLTSSCGLKAQPAMHEGHVTLTWNIEFPDQINVQHIADAMESQGIETRRWWPCGVDEMPAFEGSTTDLLPNSRVLSKQVLGFPFGPHVTAKDLAFVRDSIEPNLPTPNR